MSSLTADVRSAVPIAFGLRANWRQFWLLVLVNAFVGGMVGLERTVLPLLAEHDFGLASKSAALSFIATFGVVKAIANFFAGALSDRAGRKRILVVGWLAALPVPLLVIWAPTWSWVIAANVLLGVNQGLAWSTTIIMKIDLVGPRQRGLAMGLNEFAGYVAVALSALASGELASRFGLRPAPFYLGFVIAVLGLAFSSLFVRDTMSHVRQESKAHTFGGALDSSGIAPPTRPSLFDLLRRSLWRDRAFFSACQAGLVNNLNDGVAWGLFPLFFAAAALPLHQISLIAFVYPATWGVVQLWTGALSDRLGRKRLIVLGMGLQGIALVAIAFLRGFTPWLVANAVLGIGTAMTYPTLIAVVGDIAHPSWRGSAVGIYRLWRDCGYAAGALIAGVLADAFGMPLAIAVIGGITVLSGLVAAIRMPETRHPIN